jgi:hypothetical protein
MEDRFSIYHFSFFIFHRLIQWKCNRNVDCRFAPEGRYVYSLVSFFTPKLGRSETRRRNNARARKSDCAPNGARSLERGARSYKHLAPLERERILPPLFLFNLSNLCQSSPVALLARKARRYKRAHNLQRELFADYTSPQTQHVAVVVFA